MDFRDWEPYYELIRKEFGFSREEDERSALLLADLCRNKEICRPRCLDALVGERVTVCGHAPSLEADIERVAPIGTLIAADGATSVLMENGLRPDIIVTDLDGDMGPELEAGKEGAVIVVLAHGDNQEKISRFVPQMEGMITPTTQSRPFDDVYNFGGFTDGDRSVMLARHFGAKRIDLFGFDFEVPRSKPGRDPEVKRRKLAWVKRIIFDISSEAELSIL